MMRIRQRVLLGLLIASAVVLVSLVGRGPRPSDEGLVVGRDIRLGHFAAIEGTEVSRAALYDSSGGYSSGYSSGYRTRNILFIERSGTGRWLLPDDEHSVTEYPVPTPRPYLAEPEHVVAIVAHVIPVGGKAEEGALLLFDPSGRNIHTVAEHVAAVQGVTLAVDEIAVMFQRQGKYMLARYERSSLRKVEETPVSFPALK
jgi:hypothetical protein